MQFIGGGTRCLVFVWTAESFDVNFAFVCTDLMDEGGGGVAERREQVYVEICDAVSDAVTYCVASDFIRSTL